MTNDEFDITIIERRLLSFAPHSPTELDIGKEAIACYHAGLYIASATTACLFLEKLFTARLARNRAWHDTPNSENSESRLLDEEKKIVGLKKGEGMRFNAIVSELAKRNSIDDAIAQEAISLYKDYRIPLNHGLSRRLFHNHRGAPKDDTDYHRGVKRLNKDIAEQLLSRLSNLAANLSMN